MPPTIPRDPESSGYSVKDGALPLSVRLEGPRGLYRPGIQSTTSLVTASWKLGYNAYSDWWSFFNNDLVKGTLSFLVNLVLDDSAPHRYQAWFIPGSVKLVGMDGTSYSIQAEMEVLPTQV